MTITTKRTNTRKLQRMYTPKFVWLCMASLFFSASFNMLIPELPAYLNDLGGASYIGLIIALFTLTAGLSRPFSGKLTDTIGRRPVMLFGALVCLICGLCYPILTTVVGFLVLRLLHGFSTGFTPTAAATFVSDIVPAKRLGEAMGIYGISFSTGMALGPALGSYIKLYFSFDVLFYSSSAMALLAILLIINLKETLPRQKPFRWRYLKVSEKDLMAREALPAGIITFFAYIGLGAILTLIPDWSDHIGFTNKGLFFVVFTVASLLVRFVAGKFSDRYGRVKVIAIGLLLMLVALVLLGYLTTKNGLLVGATLYGLAMGIVSPAINAWTIDLSHPKQKGRAMATMYIALEAGIGLGALLSGWYYQSTLEHIPLVFYACALMAFFGIGYLRIKKNKNHW